MLGTPVRFIVPKGRGAELDYAVQVAPRQIELLEEFFGMAYPFGKLDVAVVPRYWGTMEHPGLLAMGQTLALMKPDQATVERKQSYFNVAIHELGHYWFGDLVTMAWWDDTWMNEGMTTWLDAKLTDRFEPAWRLGTERIQLSHRGMAEDALPSAKRVRQAVASNGEIENSFDNGSTYFKGRAIMTMAEHALGEARFLQLVRGFIRDHAWGSVTTGDWLQAVEAGAGPDLRDVFRGFLEQPGLPVVSATLVPSRQGWAVQLTQRRFLLTGGAAPGVWKIPVGIRAGVRGKPPIRLQVLLDAPAGVFEIPGGERPDWLLLNADAAGYYYSAYGPDQLEALLGPGAPALGTLERLQVLEDINALGRSGGLDLASALEFAASAAKDPDRLVCLKALSLAERVPLGLLPAPDKARMARFYQACWGARAEALGWDAVPGEGLEASRLRTGLVPSLASRGQSPILAESARLGAERWLKSRKGLDPAVVRPALAQAARTGGRDLFDRMKAAALEAGDRVERNDILGGFGGFRDPALVQEALGLVLDGPFDFRESVTIYVELISQDETRLAAWAWFQANYPRIAGRCRSDELVTLIGMLGDQLWASVDWEAFEAFLRPRAQAAEGGPLALARALESFDARLAQGRKDLEPSLRFLNGR